MSKLTKPELRDCIQSCWDCRDTCEATLYNHCLPYVEQANVRLMADCIQICQAAADFMTRSSEQHPVVCAACVEICDACADSCDAFDDDAMKRCAEVCRTCSDSCREMSRMHGAMALQSEAIRPNMPPT